MNSPYNILFVIVSWLFIFAGCTSARLNPVLPAPPVRIELKGGLGQEDLTRYYSHSRIHNFEEDQMVRARDEIVDFKVKEKVTNVDPKTGRLTINTTTVAKDGVVDLHDLAFPEMGEEIEYIFSRQGQVFKAGDYPEDSVFFVPPVPLPKTEVVVGDTWTLDHGWVGMKNGIPLGVHLVGILKNIFQCGTGRCADVEVSGQVEVIGVSPAKAQFVSTIWGHLLISVERGTVIWSEVRSKERMNVPGARTEVLSCMVASLEAPKEWQKPSGLSESCKPSEEAVKSL